VIFTIDTENPKTLRLVRRAIFDPGQFVPRADDHTEPLHAWCARAVLAAFEGKGLTSG